MENIKKAGTSLSISPIGYIIKQDDTTRIKIHPEFVGGLKELDTFSHAQIIWWFDQCDTPRQRKTLIFSDPPFQAPPLGVFACRCPMRPNVLGLSTVRILDVDEDAGQIEIEGIDADDQSPVIDIKVYLPMYDRVKDVDVPDWASQWPDWKPEGKEEFNNSK